MRYAARYDDLLRLTRVSYTRVSDGATLFAESRGFDAAGNVVGLTTTLPAGTDTQALCYDVQNRLTWASSASGSIPCGGTNTAGTLTAAQYTQSFSYDTLGRLVSGPLGPYTYGTGMQTASQTPLHAAQYIGTPGQLSPPPVPGASHARARQSSADASASADASLPGAPGALPSPGSAPPYSALYNSNGEMTCRSTSTTLSASCYGGNNGGAQMGYDAEGQLVHWQNAPGGSGSTLGSGGYTTSVNVLYDGEGNRVEQQLAQFSCGQACGTTYTTTQYVAMGIEEVTLGSSGTTTTKYYPTGTLLTAVRVNGTLSYLAADGLGSISAALSSGGTLTAAQLFAPYGGVRYSSGTMPTARGFTGQYADATTGLMYYGARYYDPVAGQFTTADGVLDGLDRYAYVAGNPTTYTDPSGQHRMVGCEEDCGPGGPEGPGDPGATQPPCDCLPGGYGEYTTYLGDGWKALPNGTWFDDYSAVGGDALVGKNWDGSGVFQYADGTTVTVDANGDVTAVNGESTAEIDAQALLQAEDEQLLRQAEGERDTETLRQEDENGGKQGNTGSQGTSPSGPQGPSGPAAPVGSGQPPTTVPPSGGENGGGNGGSGGPGGSGNPLDGIQYTSRVQNQWPVDPKYHGFPIQMDSLATYSDVTMQPGGDGVIKTWVRMPGWINNTPGTFEYIIEPDCVTCNHRFFRPD